MGKRRPSAAEQHRRAVAAYVAAGGEESVQRVITAIGSLSRKLDQWYARQLADLGVTAGEWAVIAALAKSDSALTPSQLADLTNVAPSSMTHRLDKLAERGFIERTPDAENRTRIQVGLTQDGWEFFSVAIRGSDVVESDVLQDLSDGDRAELARLLEVVIARLDDVDA
ncbi:MarR family winged helix-turn-helix transcriptional regulator [Agromyces aurantiacus]|uniref:MarR family winged helix-turn-helix transcriptional regulator n=1 Tax=Agromyces aurantiacus TaxID=165814 RepID=A0ABV9R6S8_9MICO|nr:MarR family transcriptional regulator [Agromyces aurantiacus]MBM7503939.1 DNA-binding MarR family transcriptional regulator [Agromyces aurantiacus]